ncbi:MAG: DUF6029 family protein [Chitinophagaceae bacterium]
MNIKYSIIFTICLLQFLFSHAQLSGSIESNSALFVNDNKINLASNEATQKFRNNTYLRLDYKQKNISLGIQAESYLPKALLNYSPDFKNAGLGTFYVQYNNDSLKINATVGHFYEQFGNGLVLRTWEDRQLGIANSIMGIQVKVNTYKPLQITALHGKQRNGFSLTDGIITGINAELNLAEIIKSSKWQYTIGGSLVNRNEDVAGINKKNTLLTSTRFSIKKGLFYTDFEYAFKQAEPLVENGIPNNNLAFDGDVYLLNLGFSKQRFGVNVNVRRTENFTVYSQQNLYGNAFNSGIISYVPALTKQFDYSLTNIYVYMAQSRLTFNPIATKAGELGGQVDLFYKIKPKTVFGGKYGTQISINASKWNGLSGRYNTNQRKYKTNFLKSGTLNYHDWSIEIRKKWSKSYVNSFTITNQFYDAVQIEETFGHVNATTLVFDQTIDLSKQKSIRFDIQHQWANAIQGNWLAASTEINFNSKWTVFATDLYNYGNENSTRRIHYYVAGFAFKPNALRLQLSYGRQRGGLQCIGGICRFVTENAGFSMQLNYSF